MPKYLTLEFAAIADASIAGSAYGQSLLSNPGMLLPNNISTPK